MAMVERLLLIASINLGLAIKTVHFTWHSEVEEMKGVDSDHLTTSGRQEGRTYQST